MPSQKSVDFKEKVEINDIEPRQRQKTVESSEESDDEEDERNLTGRTVSAKGQEVIIFKISTFKHAHFI